MDPLAPGPRMSRVARRRLWVPGILPPDTRERAVLLAVPVLPDVVGGFPAVPGPCRPWIPGLSLPNQPITFANPDERHPWIVATRRRRRADPIVLVLARGAVTGTLVTVTTGFPLVAVLAGNRMLAA